ACAKDANQGQTGKLHRKGTNGDEDDAEGELKELRKTVHGDRSGPQRLVLIKSVEPVVRPILDLIREQGPEQGELPLTGGQWQEGAVQNDPLRQGEAPQNQGPEPSRDKRRQKHPNGTVIWLRRSPYLLWVGE